MKIGFTGTQKGMTTAQAYSFIELISGMEIDEFHHGDCIGADYNAQYNLFDIHRNLIIIMKRGYILIYISFVFLLFLFNLRIINADTQEIKFNPVAILPVIVEFESMFILEVWI